MTRPDSLISETSFCDGPAWVSGSSVSSLSLLNSGHSLSRDPNQIKDYMINSGKQPNFTNLCSHVPTCDILYI